MSQVESLCLDHLMMFISELKNDVAVLQANLKQSHEDLHVEKEHYKWATTRVCKSVCI